MMDLAVIGRNLLILTSIFFIFNATALGTLLPTVPPPPLKLITASEVA